jgi:hypothetical protein
MRFMRLYPRINGRVPHISLVFREMWDTAGLPLKPVADFTEPHRWPVNPHKTGQFQILILLLTVE